MKNKPIFVNITTGAYEYFSDRYKQKFQSHCIYALDENGQIWKYITQKKKFILLDDLIPDYDGNTSNNDDFGEEDFSVHF